MQPSSRDISTILATLLKSYPTTTPEQQAAAHAARTWLQRHNGQSDARVLAADALDALDALLRALEGGRALDVLLDARHALERFTNEGPLSTNEPLHVRLPPAGGVTLTRNGRNVTISDSELEDVREAVNARKRELRKAETARRRAAERAARKPPR